MKKRKTTPGRVAVFIILLLGAATMVMPFLWMISTSLKEANLVYVIPPQWIPSPAKWENYIKIWNSSNLLTGIKNSCIISGCVLVFCTLTSTMAAFAFSKMHFRLRNTIFVMLLTTMMVPLVVLLVPLFVIYSKIGWIDTLLPMIIPASLCNINIIFFMRQYMMGLPSELLDAAKIDGCGYFGAYWRIFLPLSKPAIIANIIMLFMSTWNDYFAPLVFTNSASKQTVQVAIAMLNSHYIQQTDIPLMMTASLIAILPVLILFIVCQKYFTESFALTGIKG
ncbi:MAG TPA: carbohydrate ABC transporter permease [Clostridia bacterium]|nr:carbohydrate ABC transporter permease [Clostridia bacterium]